MNHPIPKSSQVIMLLHRMVEALADDMVGLLNPALPQVVIM